MSKAPRRLSVSLDEESAEKLESLKKEMDCSKARVIREALKHLYAVEEFGSSLEAVETYLDFLAKDEHVIVDVDHWNSLFEEIGEGSEEFWEEVEDIGEQHWDEYYDKGLRTVSDILEYVEKTNWYRLNRNSEKDFTLVIKVEKSKKFVKKFLESLFRASPHEVRIFEGRRKLRLNVVS
ncbi:MAG: ribbon-helix-helix protein, CopG family [Candidatus Aenigmatarchaeota archaeon]